MCTHPKTVAEVTRFLNEAGSDELTYQMRYNINQDTAVTQGSPTAGLLPTIIRSMYEGGSSIDNGDIIETTPTSVIRRNVRGTVLEQHTLSSALQTVQNWFNTRRFNGSGQPGTFRIGTVLAKWPYSSFANA